MLQFFSRLPWARPKPRARAEPAWRWRADPLSHPTLARMSERELADLPLAPPVMRVRDDERRRPIRRAAL